MGEKEEVSTGFITFAEPQEKRLSLEITRLTFTKDGIEIVTIKDVKEFFERADKIVFTVKDGSKVEFIKMKPGYILMATTQPVEK